MHAENRVHILKIALLFKPISLVIIYKFYDNFSVPFVAEYNYKKLGWLQCYIIKL